MKFNIFIYFFTISAFKTVSSDLDAEFTSVFNALESIDPNQFSVSTSIRINVWRFLKFFDRDCVAQKLDINLVENIRPIQNLTQFIIESSRNSKILSAIEDASIICSRFSKDHKDAGIIDILTFQNLQKSVIFHDIIENPNRAAECFKLSLFKSRPNSPVVKNYDPNSLSYSLHECNNSTALNEYIDIAIQKWTKNDIKSCDLKTYSHEKVVGYNVMESYLLSKMTRQMRNKYQKTVLETAINSQTEILETQIKCIMQDLRSV